jgi:retron-type reverse transcriptase
MREVLEAIYEQDFLDCSFGFRPGRSAHGALRALNQAVHEGTLSWARYQTMLARYPLPVPQIKVQVWVT